MKLPDIHEKTLIEFPEPLELDGMVEMFGFITDNPILFGLSAGALAIGGVVLLLLLRK